LPDIMRISSLSGHKYIVFLDTLNIAEGGPIMPLHSFSSAPRLFASLGNRRNLYYAPQRLAA